MSPEHARGQAVDQRADLWAFGCVLFEMLTGARPFTGESIPEILAAVLARAPDWSLLPADVPPPIRILLRRCLEKNPSDRLGDIAAASVLIDELPALTTPTGLSQNAFSRMDRGSRGTLMKAMGGGLALAVLTGVGVWLAMRPASQAIVKTMVTPSGPTVLSVGGFDRDVAITPDGSRIVYRGADQLLVRWLDSLEPTVIVRGGRPQGVFVSPDGQWIGFFDENSTLRKVAVTGGPATTLDTTAAPFPRGATWGDDDTIVFAKNGNLYRVPASGGKSTLLASPDPSTGEGSYLWPEFLPGSQVVLFTINSSQEGSRVAAFDLRARTSKVVWPGGGARYVASGHLVYRVDANVLAVPFDPDRLEVTGTPVVVLRDVAVTAGGGVNAAVSQAGTLVYVPGAGSVADERFLVWVDRMGREERVPGEPRTYQMVRLSPDGTQAAVDVRDGENDVWTYSFGAGTLTRLSSAPGNDMFPVWTRDNRRVLFSAAQDATGRRGLAWRATDGSTPVERLLDGSFRPYGLTPNGSTLLLQSAGDIFAFTLPLDGRQNSAEPTPLMQTPSTEQNAEVSPDGRWVAYQSNDSGRDEVYVRPFPNVDGGRASISTSGGRAPLWSRSGNELFYVSADGAVMAVPVNRGPVWRHGPAAQVVAPGYFHAGEVMRTFDVSLDGRRFLMIKQTAVAAGTPRSIVVVQNWFGELTRLLPGN
jgi:serine/threonine-protein kinase